VEGNRELRGPADVSVGFATLRLAELRWRSLPDASDDVAAVAALSSRGLDLVEKAYARSFIFVDELDKHTRVIVESGWLGEAVPILERGLAFAIALGDGDRVQVVRMHNRLGRVLELAEERDRAAAHYRDALALAEQVIPDAAEDLAWMRARLAAVTTAASS
jgi:hypothetical protein